MNPYELFLYTILVFKIIVLITWIIGFVRPSERNTTIRTYSDYIFTILVSILMIILFHPFSGKPTIDSMTKMFLFAFSCFTLVHTVKPSP